MDNHGRYIVLNVLIDNNPVILINYYAPNTETDQLKILNELNHIIDQLDIGENTTFFMGRRF